MKDFYKEDCFWHFELQDHNARIHGCDWLSEKGILDPDCFYCRHYEKAENVKNIIRQMLVALNE